MGRGFFMNPEYQAPEGGVPCSARPSRQFMIRVWTDSDKKWGLNPPGEVRIGSPVLSAGI